MENLQDINDSLEILQLEAQARFEDEQEAMAIEEANEAFGFSSASVPAPTMEDYIPDSPLEIADEEQKLDEMQQEVDKHYNTTELLATDTTDMNSIYVGNVDYGTNALMLEEHFRHCGPIIRLTIPLNRANGFPKGYAYIQFEHKESVEMALTMDDSVLRGRCLKILRKRKNTPGVMGARPRGSRGWGVSRGAHEPRPGVGAFGNGYSHPRMYPSGMYLNHYQYH